MKKGAASVLSGLIGIGVGIAAGKVAAVKSGYKERYEKMELLSEKHLALMLLYDQWLKAKQHGKSIAGYLKQNNFNTVAVYGMSYVGERLYDELKDTGIEVKYAIDRNAESIYSELDVLLPEDNLPEVEVIIVTPVYFYHEIEEMLTQKTNIKVLSLKNILADL